MLGGSLSSNLRTASVAPLLVVFCLLAGVLIAADTFPVCERCNCALLPKTLDGRLVDVPSSLDWLVFNESIISNQTAVLLFRSVDSSCNAEIKLKSINSSVHFVVYPAGRMDPTIGTDDLGPAWFCNTWSKPLLLGPSVVSTGSELAIAFIKPNEGRLEVTVQFLYRQHCPASMSVLGLPLGSPPVNGSTRIVQLANTYMGAGVPGASSNVITWSVAPPLNCAMEVTFTRSTNNTLFALNEVNPAFLGITHRVSQGREAIIRVWKYNIFHSVNAVVDFEYRAVDCGAPLNPHGSAELQIASWNGVVKPLKRLPVPVGDSPWQVVDFTFANDGLQQLAIWFLSGPEPAYEPFTSWKTDENWDSRIPKLYSTDFFTRFSNVIMTGTFPIVALVLPNTGISTSFGYAFLPAAASPELVATAGSSVPINLLLTQDMLLKRRVYIKAANESCAVAVWLVDNTYATTQKIRILPFGFNSTYNDLLDDYRDYYQEDDKYAGVNVPYLHPIRSVGPVMGIQFYGWMDLTANPSNIFCRMVCPVRLSTAIHSGKWHYVSGNARTFLLPQPTSRRGRQCWVDISSVSTSGVLPRDRDVHLLVACLQTPMHAEVLGSHTIRGSDTPCNGSLHVDAYSHVSGSNVYTGRNISVFAYRVQCEGDSIGKDDGRAPFIPLKTTIVANDKWTILDTQEYEYEYESHWYVRDRRNMWMLQAKDPECHVEMYIDKTFDLSSINIVEDFMDDTKMGIYELNMGVEIKHIRYISCDRRVFVVGLRWGVGKENKFKYRQLCGVTKPGLHCTQKLTVEPSSDGKWSTMQGVSNGNLNQLHQLQYRIELPDVGNSTSPNRLLEVEFTSLISGESWNGAIDDGREADKSAEIHGVWLNSKFRAIAGKQYLFKNSVDISVDSLLRTKRGDHIFTARYRLADEKQARGEMRLGEVLVATNKAKHLEFKVPPQFSNERLKAIRKQQFVMHDDNYAESFLAPGDFPIWFFRHQYTIKPLNASCQVALRFTKMDIGSGLVYGGSRRYSNTQHRLSVTSFSKATRRIPITCKSGLIDDVTLYHNMSLCVRMDNTYVSAPDDALAVLFRSGDVGEYEYERIEQFLGVNGPEVTFGSGWTAIYKQVCDSTETNALATVRATVIKAKPMGKIHLWQTGLPGQWKSDQYRLFRDKRWVITAEQASCAVQYRLESNVISRTRLTVAFRVGAIDTPPRVNETVISPNVTVVQLGTSKDSSFAIKYRQVCTQLPTASPTATPLPVAVGSRHDGETCAHDQQCASMMCPKSLFRCSAPSCAPQCAVQNNSRTVCKSYATKGCSCDWQASTNTCIPVV